MAKKSTTVRENLTLPAETDEAIRLLAEEWRMSKAAVIKLLIARGLTIEAARRLGYTPLFQDPDGQTTRSWPDDRPTKQLPFDQSDFLRRLKLSDDGDKET